MINRRRFLYLSGGVAGGLLVGSRVWNVFGQLSSVPGQKVYPSAKVGSLETIEAGDFGKASFAPKLKFNAFHPDEACWASLNLNMTGTLNPLTAGNDISFATPDMAVIWRPTTIIPTFNERGGFDMIITLFKPPVGNYLNFDFDSSKILPYLQPELTAQEIADGDWSPEHAVNSIALYHSTKGVLVTPSEVGRFITTGKLGHLYNMLCTDANGVKVFGAWTIEGGNQFRFHIPPGLKYPITIAPVGDTFGYTTLATGTTESIEGVIMGEGATGAAGTATKMTAGILVSNVAHNTKCAIYTTADSALITNGVTNEVAVEPQDLDWVDFPFASPPAVSATNYAIVAWSAAASGANAIGRDTAAGTKYSQTATYNGYPNPATFTTTDNRRMSIYVTYTAGGGGWSNISKVDGVGEAAIGKVAGVEKAAIGKVAGVTP